MQPDSYPFPVGCSLGCIECAKEDQIVSQNVLGLGPTTQDYIILINGVPDVAFLGVSRNPQIWHCLRHEFSLVIKNTLPSNEWNEIEFQTFALLPPIGHYCTCRLSHLATQSKYSSLELQLVRILLVKSISMPYVAFRQTLHFSYSPLWRQKCAFQKFEWASRLNANGQSNHKVYRYF